MNHSFYVITDESNELVKYVSRHQTSSNKPMVILDVAPVSASIYGSLKSAEAVKKECEKLQPQHTFTVRELGYK